MRATTPHNFTMGRTLEYAHNNNPAKGGCLAQCDTGATQAGIPSQWDDTITRVNRHLLTTITNHESTTGTATRAHNPQPTRGRSFLCKFAKSAVCAPGTRAELFCSHKTCKHAHSSSQGLYITGQTSALQEHAGKPVTDSPCCRAFDVPSTALC